MQRVRELVREVAPTPISVLIRGESGTGKQLVAEAVHERSQRRGKFVVCNCAAMASGVLESELFGHEKGAFTGAVASHKGRFEEAEGGTLFLDEIGDLTMEMQIRLLRVLQEGEFEPVGSVVTKVADVRLVAATHRDLEEAVKVGDFREDLYYRINALEVSVPPLRERVSDIPLLGQHFLLQGRAELDQSPKRLSAKAMTLLETYWWPGNVREFENALMRALVLSKTDEIGREDLPPAMLIAGDVAKGGPEPEHVYQVSATLFHEARAQFEKIFIDRALRRSKGNISHASEEIDLGRRNLQKKLQAFGIDAAGYRA